MHPVQSIGYAAAYPAYPLNPPLSPATRHKWTHPTLTPAR